MVLFLALGTTDLHGPAANASTVITTSPVLSDSQDVGEHFDRFEGELPPEHPSALLKKLPSQTARPPRLSAPLVTAACLRFVEPAIKEPLLGMLLPARAPPAE